MRFRHSFKNYMLLCGVIVTALLAIYGTLVLSVTQKPQPKPVTVSSNVSCSFPDKTFCNTDQLIRRYVSANDYSDILENQTPITVSCASKAQAQQYCNGVQNDQAVQLYKVVKGPSAQLLSRNSYIDFFRTYVPQHGPFKFAGDASAGSDVIMTFENTTHSADYILTFTKSGTQWNVAYVSVTG